MQIFKPLIIFLAFVLFTAGQCSKSTEVPITNTLCLTTKHHEIIQPNIPIYIRFDNAIFPGYDRFYDYDTVLITDENGKVCMDNPPDGKHWCVAIGYDPIILDSVRGSTSVEIENPRHSIDTLIRVTEVH